MTHSDPHPDPDPDHALRQLLVGLRADPLDGNWGNGEDGGAAFSASLHRRLVHAGSPAPVGAREHIAAWLRERPWVTGMVSGALTGVAAFALMQTVTATDSGAGPQVVVGTPAATHVSQAGERDLRDQPVAEVASIPQGRAAQDGDPGPAPDAVADAVADPTAAPAVTDCEPDGPAVAQASAQVTVLPAGQVAMVQLHFAVERGVDEAEFSILLPAGLAFFSEGQALSERSFHWVAPLSAGDNEIPVAIVGQSPGVHRVTATATIDGEVVVHEVVLEVREAV